MAVLLVIVQIFNHLRAQMDQVPPILGVGLVQMIDLTTIPIIMLKLQTKERTFMQKVDIQLLKILM